MLRTILALLLMLAVAPTFAQAAETPAPADPRLTSGASPDMPPTALLSTLDFVPADTDVAVLVRFDALRRTGLWKRLTAPPTDLCRRWQESLPVAIDFEKDVAAAAWVAEIAYAEGRPDGLRYGLVLEMARDIRITDLLRQTADNHPTARLGVPAFDVGPDLTLAAVGPRLFVLASRDYVGMVLATPSIHLAPPSGAILRDALTAPGEAAFVARASPALKEAIQTEYTRLHQGLLRPNLGGESLMQFSLYYNLVRLALQTETVTGSLDLSGDADALRAEIRFASPGMAPFAVAILQAMADPLQMGLPALVGGQPIEEPPPELFYRTVVEGSTVRLTMTRHAVDRFAGSLLAAARQAAAFDTSAENLRHLGAAIRDYAAHKGAYPRLWTDLARASLLPDPTILMNPAANVHRPTGDYELMPLPTTVTGDAAAQTLLAYECFSEATPPPRLNVLYADGHVEQVTYEAFQALYRKAVRILGH